MPVYIVFAGICAFVKTSAKRVRVVIPNFQTPVDVHGSAVVPGHAGFIRFSADAPLERLFVNGKVARSENFTVVDPSAPARRSHVLLLDREVITIEPRPMAPAKDVEFNSAQIVQLREVVDDHHIDDALVSDEFDPEPERVLAWVDIDRGRVFAPKEALRTLEFQPRKDFANPYRGAFGEQVIWELPPDEYVLSSRSFGSRAHPIEQWAIHGGGAANVFMWVGNLPLEDLTNPSSPQVRERDHELVDHHFHRFYELCAKTPAQHPLPRRVSARSLATNSDGGNCPPAVFEL